MAKSIKQVQQELLNEGQLDKMGLSKSDTSSVNSLPFVERFMITSTGAFILQAIENLHRSGKIASGALETGLTQGELIKTGSKYEISAGYRKSDQAVKYYDFVNKGVRGAGSGSKNSTSPYKFKSLNVSTKSDTGIYAAIKNWIKSGGVQARNEDQKKGLSKLQKKRKKLSKAVDKNESIAYAIAKSIKKKGFARTGYLDNAIDSHLGKEFGQAIAKATGLDIRLNIRNDNNT